MVGASRVRACEVEVVRAFDANGHAQAPGLQQGHGSIQETSIGAAELRGWGDDGASVTWSDQHQDLSFRMRAKPVPYPTTIRLLLRARAPMVASAGSYSTLVPLCSQRPGFRTAPVMLRAASLVKAMRVW